MSDDALIKRTRYSARIMAERERQVQLLAEGKIIIQCERALTSNLERLSVFGEEAGEVFKEVCEEAQKGKDPARTERLRTELIQTAAVCLAWLEGIDGQ